MKQSTNEKVFFQSLYDLCKKHKVNLVADNVDFKGKTTNSDFIHYDWVEVNGAWQINPENEAVVTNRVETRQVGATFTIKGQV